MKKLDITTIRVDHFNRTQLTNERVRLRAALAETLEFIETSKEQNEFFKAAIANLRLDANITRFDSRQLPTKVQFLELALENWAAFEQIPQSKESLIAEVFRIKKMEIDSDCYTNLIVRINSLRANLQRYIQTLEKNPNDINPPKQFLESNEMNDNQLRREITRLKNKIRRTRNSLAVENNSQNALLILNLEKCFGQGSRYDAAKIQALITQLTTLKTSHPKNRNYQELFIDVDRYQECMKPKIQIP
jgi:hypothetical protein